MSKNGEHKESGVLNSEIEKEELAWEKEEEKVYTAQSLNKSPEIQSFNKSPEILSYPPQPETIPDRYGVNKIVLMVRDPSWLYSYWDITETRFYEALSSLEIGQDEKPIRILRIFDISDPSFEGIHDKNVNFYFDINLDQNARSWYIRVDPNRSYCVEIGLLTSNGRFVCVARSNVVKTPRNGMSDEIDEQWGSVGEEYYNEMYALSGGFDVGKSSLELRQMLEERLRSEMSSGAVSSFGASPVKKREKERGFWFVLDAELIVYGATAPDASVTIQGKPIKLRPDGSFTLRFALPDGMQEIEAKALSADEMEERTITPVVSRETYIPEPVIHGENS